MALKAAKLKILAQMAPTCWGSIKAKAETMLAAKAILHQLVTVQGFISGDAKQKAARQAIQNTVTSANFVNLLKKTLMVIKHINTAIIFYQSDAVPVSEVFYTFSCKIPSAILAMPIPCVEIDYLMKLCQHCFDFMYGNSHGIAYLLDLQYVGDLMPLQMCKRIEDLIYMHSLPDGEEPTSLSEEDV